MAYNIKEKLLSCL